MRDKEHRVSDQDLGCFELHTFLLNHFFSARQLCVQVSCVSRFTPEMVNSPGHLDCAGNPRCLQKAREKHHGLGPAPAPTLHTLVQPLSQAPRFCPAGLQKGEQEHGLVQDEGFLPTQELDREDAGQDFALAPLCAALGSETGASGL